METSLTPDYGRLVSDLERLSLQHLLYFRVQVGRVVATQLFGGDIEVMRAHVASRQGVIRDFATAHPQRLDDLGLNESLLRESLKAWAVVQLLPAAIVERLGFTHVVQLSRVEDDQTRRLLAEAVVENAWDGRALKDAVASVRAGVWPDVELDEPGLQPAPPPEEGAPPPLAAGRVVNRFEKAADDLAELVAPWEHADLEKLTTGQRKRAKAALKKLRERVQRLEARLS